MENGEFDEMVPESCQKLSPAEDFKQCLESSKVVVMIEGTLEEPATTETGALLKILKDSGIKFAAIDLLKKPEVHDLLKS